MGRVRNDDAVEAQLPAQQILQQLRRERGGHDLRVLQTGAELPAHGGQRDLTDHDRLQPILNQRAVDLAEALVPLVYAEIIDRKREMRVQLVHAVAGEVLCRAGHMRRRVLDAADIRLAVGDHLVRLAAEAAGVDDGVAPVLIYVSDRIEHPVHADGRGLLARYIAHGISRLRASGGACLCRRGHEGALRHRADAAVIAVGSHEQRQLAVALIKVTLAVDRMFVAALPAQAALVEAIQCVADLRLVQTGLGFHQNEQLPKLFFQGHGRDLHLYPLNFLVCQIKRFCFQVYHRRSSFKILCVWLFSSFLILV